MDICAIRELRPEDALYWLRDSSLGLGRAENALLQNPAVGDRTLITAAVQIMTDALEEAVLLAGPDCPQPEDYADFAADPKEQYIFHRDVASLMGRMMAEVYKFTEKWTTDRLGVPKRKRITSNLEVRKEKEAPKKEVKPEKKKEKLITLVNHPKKEKNVENDIRKLAVDGQKCDPGKARDAKHYANREKCIKREKKILDFQENCQREDFMDKAWTPFGVDPEEDAVHWHEFVNEFFAQQKRTREWVLNSPLEEYAKKDSIGEKKSKFTFSKPPSIKERKFEPLTESTSGKDKNGKKKGPQRKPWR